MWAYIVLFALLLAVAGNFGCASTERLYHRAAKTDIQPLQPKPPAEIFSDSITSTSRPETIAPSGSDRLLQERNPLAQPQHLNPPASGATSERTENREKGALSPAKPAPTQAQRGLQADNRLLELLERDLDKAVEQAFVSCNLEIDM